MEKKKNEQHTSCQQQILNQSAAESDNEHLNEEYFKVESPDDDVEISSSVLFCLFSIRTVNSLRI